MGAAARTAAVASLSRREASSGLLQRCSQHCQEASWHRGHPTEGLLRREHSARAEHVAPEALRSVTHILQNCGSPMSDNVRSGMQSSFGYDFSQIRVQIDQEAAASARALDTAAYAFEKYAVFFFLIIWSPPPSTVFHYTKLCRLPA